MGEGRPELECIQCGHRWAPKRASKPSKCPGCGTGLWNRGPAYRKKVGRGAFGRKLRLLRTKYGLSARQLSALSGVHRNRILDYQNGVMQPSLEVARRLAHAFGRGLEVWDEPENEIVPSVAFGRYTGAKGAMWDRPASAEIA